MTRQQLKEYFELDKKVSDRTTILYKSMVDLIDYNDSFYGIIKLLGEELFSKFGWDHISNFELESKESYSFENPMCWDGETKEPLYWDIDSLYDYMVREKYILVKTD